MNKKKLLSLALVVVLIATISFGTLAWFNDKDEVTNTFMVATSDDATDPDDIFSVDVMENIDTNNDGVPDATVGDNNVENDGDGKDYHNILPGDVLVKEPVVKNTGEYPQFVRMKVTFSDAKAWQEMIDDDKFDALTDLLKGYNDAKWHLYGAPVVDTTADTITYTYYLNRILYKGETETLFTDVEIPSTLDQDDLAKIKGDFKITVVAEAVQTENVGSNALEAFTTVMGG